MSADASHLSDIPLEPETAVLPLVVPAPRRGLKRLLDLVVGALAVVVLAPVLVCLAVLVRLSGPGPVLFRQVRVGQHGRPIVVHKFRSMVVDAERRLADLEMLNEVADGPLFKMREDPRVTPIGRWMRRFSLDELPQLIEVFQGSMSLVGPRPALPSEVDQYGPDAHRRLWVKPGMTGLWQVSGRSDLTWEDGIRLDLHYVEHQSVWLDVSILLRTLPAVALARGAY